MSRSDDVADPPEEHPGLPPASADGHQPHPPRLVRAAVFFDGRTDRRYCFSDSPDGFKTWTPVRQLPGISGVVHNFTVLREAL